MVTGALLLLATFWILKPGGTTEKIPELGLGDVLLSSETPFFYGVATKFALT
jgi:hypothetical protein